jgi:hypothetical protein
MHFTLPVARHKIKVQTIGTVREGVSQLILAMIPMAIPM